MKKTSTFSIVSLLSMGLISFSQAQLPLETEFFFPHIVEGGIAQAEGSEDVFQTVIVLSNPSDEDANVNLSFNLFTRGEDGQPTDVDAATVSFRCLELAGPCEERGQTLRGDELEDFTIPARGLLHLALARDEAPDTDPDADPDVTPATASGFAEVTSDIPITGMAFFSANQNRSDEETGEVGVSIKSQAAVPPAISMQRFAIIDFRQNTFAGSLNGTDFDFADVSSTGLAVVNVGEEATTVTVRAFDASGNAATGITGGELCEQFDEPADPPDGDMSEGAACSFRLEAGEHRSFFLSEGLIFPEDANGVVSATVIVESTDTLSDTSAGDLTAVALKFDDESVEGDTRLIFTAAPVVRLDEADDDESADLTP